MVIVITVLLIWTVTLMIVGSSNNASNSTGKSIDKNTSLSHNEKIY